MKQLDPKAVWLFFLSPFNPILFIFLFIFFLNIFAASFSTIGNLLTDNLTIGLFSLPAGISILLVINFIWAKLSYKYYKYELREDGFRKESGVIWKKYVTIPYERIQNVDIYRGLLARLLGLSDLHIQTAGMSASVGRYGFGGAGAEGRLPGVSQDEAEKLRDELIKRARGSKNQGI